MDSHYEESKSEIELWNSIPQLDGIERAETYFNLSLLAFEQGEHTRSLALAETACSCFIENKDDVGSANCLTSIAFNLNELGQEWEAIRALLRAVIRYSRIGDPQEWEYRGYLAQWLSKFGEKELALIQFQKCLEHYSNENFGIAIARFNDEMARLLCELNQCTAAIKKFEVARTILKKEKEPALVGATDISIARCYNHLKDGYSARDYAFRALGIFESTSNIHKKAEALAQLGQALNNLELFEDALDPLNRAHQMITGWRSPDFYLIYLIQKGKIKALQGLGRSEEAESIERRNRSINEIMEYEQED